MAISFYTTNMFRSQVAKIICWLLVINYATGIDFKKNACKKYDDYPMWFWSSDCFYNPDVLSEVPTMIKSHGYPVEGYTVRTADGYVIMMFRIPPVNNKKNRQPVYLQNGILTCAATWVNVGNRSLAFRLADWGYDVWLGSTRGSRYSKVHTKYRPTDSQFWDFSLDDVASQDFRDQLKFIAQKTGKAGSIIAIGHSMGGTVAFMYASTFTEESKRMLKGIISLAPGVYFEKEVLVRQTKQLYSHLTRLLAKHNTTGMFYQPGVNAALTYACTIMPQTCVKFFSLLFGNIQFHTPPEELLLISSYFPDGVSIKLLRHYQQMVITGKFQKYDYGFKINEYRYGNPTPPKYDLSLIKLPVFIFYGAADPLFTSESVDRLWRELGSSRKVVQVIPKDKTIPPYNHIDVTGAKDIEKNLHPVLLEALRELGDQK